MPESLAEAELLLYRQDPEMAALIAGEEVRQQTTLRLIPSENHASLSVRLTLAFRTSDNYAEGYPGGRYYQGQKYNDLIERLTRARMMALFGTSYANVQPYSGSPANLAVYKALLQPGDTVMGLSLDAGGHLTHGARVSITGREYNSSPYNVGPDGYIDYDDLARQAKAAMPKLIIAGTTAYPRILDWARFAQIADESGAYLMADIAHVAGLVAGGAYPSPVEYADVITGTGHKTFRGPRSGFIMVTARGLNKYNARYEKNMGLAIDKAVFPMLQGGPHINTIAALGIAAQEASTPQFKRYASQVVENARVLSKTLTSLGLQLVTGGTDSHLMLIDLQDKKILGNTAAEGLERAGLVANRNSVPNAENQRPYYPFGLRLGTPAITSRGMGLDQMRQIGSWVVKIIDEVSASQKKLGLDETKSASRTALINAAPSIPSIRRAVSDLCGQFPIPDFYT